MKHLSQFTATILVLIVMGLLLMIGPAASVIDVNAATYGYGYNTVSGGAGGGGGGHGGHVSGPVVGNVPTNTRTLENVPATGEQSQSNTNANGLTGAAVTGSTSITNYALGGIIGLVILGFVGFFLWKKYK